MFIAITLTLSALFVLNDIAFRLWKRYILKKYIGYLKDVIWLHRQWELERELDWLTWYNWLWKMDKVLFKIKYWSRY